MSALSDRIAQIASKLKSGSFPNESTVREALVLPILHGLGWDIYDMDQIIREYSVSSRRVDYALRAIGQTPSIFLEVKSPGKISGGDRQLFEYAFHVGIPMAILTDGQEWHFYLPAEQGSYDERRIYKLDLVERDAIESASVLERYLAFTRVKNGDAVKDAQLDYRQARLSRTAAEAIPKAWIELIVERDELLLELIAEKTETLCGLRPTAEQIELFLTTINLKKDAGDRPASNRNPAPEKIPEKYSPTPPPSPIRKSIFVEYRGQEIHCSSAMDATVQMLEKFSELKPQFWQELAKSIQGRSRNHLALSREQVYPQHPHLASYTQKIGRGWWIGTNIANREKMRIVKAAAEVAGLVLGRDFRFELPNAD